MVFKRNLLVLRTRRTTIASTEMHGSPCHDHNRGLCSKGSDTREHNVKLAETPEAPIARYARIYVSLGIYDLVTLRL